MSNFDPNAILRGAQLTLVGAHRALQNPELFKSAHYSQALKAVVIGVFIRLLISAPIVILRFTLFLLSFILPLSIINSLQPLLASLSFLENSVLQIPLFLMSLMRYLNPTLDSIFMLSLAWVDKTYLAKHLPASVNHPEMAVPKELQNRLYHPTLRLYEPHKNAIPPRVVNEKDALKPKTLKKNSPLKSFLLRSAKKALISLGIYLATFIPYFGPLVLPASSIYSLNSVTGPLPAGIFAFCSLFIFSKSLTVRILQTYFSSRSLVRDLLEPYFSRLPFTAEQKRRWFRDREGLLLGFGVGWMLLVKVPLVGVLVYGIAEASTAYLITKITSPVPPPPTSSSSLGSSFIPNEKGGYSRPLSQLHGEDNKDLATWCETQTRWKNKQKFLSLPAEFWDKFTGGGGVDEEGNGGVSGGVPTIMSNESVRFRRQWPGGYVSPSDRHREEGREFTGGRI
ncbi:hypothetical protein L211DRAFT_840644 [Terfezia boudieri ATCC MYA-4762]|uniref:Transmembrane protein UsgS n=1 Tax=Terfezia boudieri ATCC MYA-4762 TaxID=1051890 RepID=A0A3N4LTV3_9PEZI|nr:hypothetical protein L211DRAFT_840644 [Terfezia boudieri ATCC MYA-4762]